MDQDFITILYLHGFLSSGQSEKSKWYQQKFSEVGIHFFSPTYPQQPPEKSVTFLINYIETKILGKTDKWVIIGSSMGGFLGQYLTSRYHVPLIMINPALHPLKLFNKYLGEHTNKVTGEHLVIDEHFVNQLTQYDQPIPKEVPVLLLQDKNDEVIPYEWANEKYANRAEINLYEGGNHAFQHLEQSWEDVKKFIVFNTRK